MPSKSTLNFSLTPELTALIAAKIKTGHYRSASEVVRAALRLLYEQDRCGPSRTEIAVQIEEQGDAG